MSVLTKGKRSMRFVKSIFMKSVLILFVACSFCNVAIAKEEIYSARLSGDGIIMYKKLPIFNPEVPGQITGWFDYPSPIATGATGKMTLEIKNNAEIHYKVRIEQEKLWVNADGTPGVVGVVHIHLGGKQAFGPIMFEAFNRMKSGQFPGEVSGVLKAEDLYTTPTSYGDLPDTLAEYGIKSMDDAIAAIRQNNASVKVHTGRHWLGELGGELQRVNKRVSLSSLKAHFSEH